MILGRAQRARIQQIAKGRSDEPLRVLEGAKAVRDALDAGVVHELWLRRDLGAELAADLVARAGRADVPVGEGDARDFERLGGTVSPQGVLALVADTATSLAAVLDLAGPWLWLDGVQDPGNVGAVVRVAAAFGVAGLLVGEGSADPLGLKALRASAGLALALPFARASATDIAAACAARGRPVWALDTGGDDVLAVAETPPGLVLAVGAEGPGLSDAARTAATRRVGVPLAPRVDSLNAAVAVGIAAAWLFRRAVR
jgi:TrmH family RNA methyltransferase